MSLQNAVTSLPTINFSSTEHFCFPLLHYVSIMYLKVSMLLLKSVGHTSAGHVPLDL